MCRVPGTLLKFHIAFVDGKAGTYILGNCFRLALRVSYGLGFDRSLAICHLLAIHQNHVRSRKEKKESRHTPMGHENIYLENRQVS